MESTTGMEAENTRKASSIIEEANRAGKLVADDYYNRLTVNKSG